MLAGAGCAMAGGAGPEGAGPALAETPLIDGHNDLLIHYLDKARTAFLPIDAYDISAPTPGQVDLPRLRAGRVGAAIFTTAILEGQDPEAGIRASTGVLRQLASAHPDDLEIVTGVAGLLRAFDKGRMGVLMGLEGADRIAGSLDAVHTLHRHGVRAMTLVWEKTNALGDSNADAPRHGGLSAFGAEVVGVMNRLGMLIDLSHAAETTALDVLGRTRAPVIFSHSSARALCPAPRNVSDALLKAVAANGGIVMVSFVPYFTTPAYREWYDRGEAVWADLTRRHAEDTAAIARAMAEWDAANPSPIVTVADVADHVEHVRQIAGVDHVGLGSDFDGMGTFRVSGLEDASTFPALLKELASRGWTDQELAKVAGGNFLRVFREVEAVADGPSVSR